MTRRIDAAADISPLVDSIAAESIQVCLRQLTAAVFDVVQLPPSPAVQRTLTHLRSWSGGTALDGAVAHELHAQILRLEFDGYLAQRAADGAAHRVAFAKARALSCLQFAVADDLDPRERLGEAAYEAVAAFASPAAVVGILADFVE